MYMLSKKRDVYFNGCKRDTFETIGFLINRIFLKREKFALLEEGMQIYNIVFTAQSFFLQRILNFFPIQQ